MALAATGQDSGEAERWLFPWAPAPDHRLVAGTLVKAVLLKPGVGMEAYRADPVTTVYAEGTYTIPKFSDARQFPIEVVIHGKI